MTTFQPGGGKKKKKRTMRRDIEISMAEMDKFLNGMEKSK